MEKEEILRYLQKNSLKPEDTFKFKCEKCAKCCYETKNISLSPVDIIRLSKHFDRSNVYIIDKYCQIVVGDESKIPIIILRFSGKKKACPFLVKNRCSVQKAKPAICTLFPLGRAYISENGESRYFLPTLQCGNTTEEHRVSDWVSSLAPYDEAYRIWNQILSEWAMLAYKLHARLDTKGIVEFSKLMAEKLYIGYSNTDDITEQLRERKKELDKDREEFTEILNKAES